MNPHDHDYSDVMQKFKIPSLAYLRKVKYSIMAYKRFVSEIDCEELCDKFLNRELLISCVSLDHFLNPLLVPDPKRFDSLLCRDLLALGITLIPSSVTGEIYFPKFEWLVKSTLLKYE